MALERKVKLLFNNNREDLKFKLNTPCTSKFRMATKKRRKKRQKRTPHNDKSINPRRRYNNYKYICTQHMSTSIHKANDNKYERGNYQ